MELPGSSLPLRRAVLAALLGSLGLLAVLVPSFGLLLLADGRALGGEQLLLGALGGAVTSLVVQAPFLLAVVLVVEGSLDAWTLAVAVALVYVPQLLSAVAVGLLWSVPLSAQVLVSPLPAVGTALGIAVAYWVAYGGGYERFLGNVSPHPLLAPIAERRLAPSLSVARGVVAATLAAVVAVAVLVVAARLGDLLAPTAGVFGNFRRGPSVALGDLPRRLLLDAAFLLAVLVVVGPGTRLRDVLAGTALVLVAGVASGVLTIVVPPSPPVRFLDPGGPILGQLPDLTLLVGIALAVWLAHEGGIETLRRRFRSDAGAPG